MMRRKRNAIGMVVRIQNAEVIHERRVFPINRRRD